MKVKHVRVSDSEAFLASLKRSRKRTGRVSAARLIGASVSSLLVGLIGFEIVRTVRNAKHRKRLEEKLDQALDSSMQSGDSTATY